MNYSVNKSDDEWRAELSEFEYHVLREAGTERAFTGELLEEARVGTFSCRGCGAELFKSTTKFDSHCGCGTLVSNVQSYGGPTTLDLLQNRQCEFFQFLIGPKLISGITYCRKKLK